MCPRRARISEPRMGKNQPTVKLVQQLRLRRFARTDFSQHPEGHGAGAPVADGV